MKAYFPSEPAYFPSEPAYFPSEQHNSAVFKVELSLAN